MKTSRLKISVSGAPATARRMVAKLRSAARMLGVTGGEWSISLVDDHTMGQLHARTMNIPTTTDVLTFDLGDGVAGCETRQHIELDTVICIDEACRRAAEFDHAVDREILLYAVHSLLHVVGYDDTTPAKFRAMHAREDEILTALGVGPVFAKTTPPKESRKKVRR